MHIDTGRLSLRALTRDEAEAVVAGDRDTHAWAPDYPTPGDTRIAAFVLEGGLTFATDSSPWGPFVIVDAASGLSVGGIGFKGSPNGRGQVEIGYGVCSSHQRRGVATESVLAMCDLARRGATEVLAETEYENVASQRVLAKSGFQRTDTGGELMKWRKMLSTNESSVGA